ncbi:MAG: hypothetical protein MJ165_02235 [Alphaproteobacteria bacterium]|nr:hypothetical protein [Alphaproteobacteria bacterium]
MEEIRKIRKKAQNDDVFVNAKDDATRLVESYMDKTRSIRNTPFTVKTFWEIVNMLEDGPLKQAALKRLSQEYPTYIDQIKPRKLKLYRRRSENADSVELNFVLTTLKIYRRMGLVKKKQYKELTESADVKKIDKFLANVRTLNHEQELEFAEYFAYEYRDNLSCVPPIILARAHESLRIKTEKGKEDLYNMVGVRIDELSSHFALYFDANNYRPSNKDKLIFNFADRTNIADAFDGYRQMFEERLKFFNRNPGYAMYVELKNNIDKINKIINVYDEEWKLNSVLDDEDELEVKWGAVNTILENTELSPDVIKQIAGYKFLNKQKKPIPQFIDENGEKHVDYQDGYKIDPDGRLNQIIKLAKHDVALRSIGDPSNPQNDRAELANRLNDRVLYKLFEIDTVAKALDSAKENPDQFTNPEHWKQFIKNLNAEGGSISEVGYNFALDDQVDKTAGFAARLNSKLKDLECLKNGNLIGSLFKPIENIDKRAGARIKDDNFDKRKTKIEFFKRLFKTFGNTLLASAMLSAVGISAATIAGINPAIAIATVGVATAIARVVFQINKWRKNQQKLGLPDDLQTMLQDKRMLLSWGISGAAALALVFGAAGFTAAALALGYGAITVGGVTNARQTYQDALNRGLDSKSAIAWGIGMAVAALVGGILGRAGVKAFASNTVSTTAPENAEQAEAQTNGEEAVAQQESQQEVQPQQQEPVVQEQSQELSYTQEALEHEQKITQYWYQDDLNQLQHDTDLVRQYNETHGTHIDPNRAVVMRALAGGHVPSNHEILVDDAGNTRFTHGNVKVFGAGWLKAHPDFTATDIKEAANVFSTGTASEAGMDAIARLDKIVSFDNHVGHAIPEVQSVNGMNTYTDGRSAFVEQPVIEDNPVVETPVVEEPVEQPTNQTQITGGMNMFGPLNFKVKAGMKKLRNRMGSFLDNVFQTRQR